MAKKTKKRAISRKAQSTFCTNVSVDDTRKKGSRMKKPLANHYRLFISSVQKELAAERRAVKDFITHDPLLSRFISDVFLLEDIPAGDRQPEDIYLDEVEQRDIYLAILGNEYGWKNEDGKSPTELEFDHATKTRRERLVFVKGNDDKTREPDYECGVPEPDEY